MNYNELCEEILKYDSKVRFVGVFDQEHKLYSKMREGLQGFLNQEETDKSMRFTYIRWRSRHALSSKTGMPIYAMALYEKVKRITFSLDPTTLLLVSTEVNADHEKIIEKILEQKDHFQNNV